jgi:predicted AAA+ superfamily ATPase
VSGSSSKLLSKELATSLRGRSVATHLYPLSFAELASYRGVPVRGRLAWGRERFRLVSLLDEYLAWGGLFEVQDATDEPLRRRIVSTHLDLVVYKDLVERYSVKNLGAMKALIRYFVTNATRRASLTRLSGNLGVPAARNTVAQYTSFLEDVNFLYACPKLSYELRQGNTPSKYYLADPCFKTVAGLDHSADRGAFFENAVYMELRRRGEDVSFFEDGVECDFVVKRGTKVAAAIQVCVDPAAAGERETRGLLAALDAFSLDRGTIVCSDDDREETIAGKTARYFPLWRWLVEGAPEGAGPRTGDDFDSPKGRRRPPARRATMAA